MQLKDGILKLDKELSQLDKEVFEFVTVLDKHLDYVIVSGYLAILTGRSRGTEDIDLLIEQANASKIANLASDLSQAGYWCINTDLDQINDMLKDEIAVRVAKKKQVLPNFELKLAEDEFEQLALETSIRVEISDQDVQLKVSPIELQIIYKLFLGSEKDFEDALHLYQLFKRDIDPKLLRDYAKKMEVKARLNELKQA